MRFKCQFILLAFSFLPFSSMAQIKIGIKSGANISTIKGLTKDPKLKLGWYAGAIFKMESTKDIAFQAEILFSSKGCGLTYITPAPYEPPKSNMRFNYMNLPILVFYKIGKKVKLFIGPELGYLLSVRQTMESNVYKSDFYYPSKFDIAGDIGAECSITPKWEIDARYSYGFKTLRYRDVTGTYSQNRGGHRTFQIGLNYFFK